MKFGIEKPGGGGKRKRGVCFPFDRKKVNVESSTIA